MTNNSIADWFSKLSQTEKSQFVCDATYELTITARDSSLWSDASQGESEAVVLRAICEILHTLTGQLSKLLKGDLNRFPDDIVWDIVLEKGSQGGVKDAVLRALERARKYA